MSEVDLFSYHKSAFSGRTYEPKKDKERLERQADRVLKFMSDGQWHTLQEIAAEGRGSPTGVSARLRDFRKSEFGSRTVQKDRVAGGLYRYRLVPRSLVHLTTESASALSGQASAENASV